MTPPEANNFSFQNRPSREPGRLNWKLTLCIWIVAVIAMACIPGFRKFVNIMLDKGALSVDKIRTALLCLVGLGILGLIIGRTRFSIRIFPWLMMPAFLFCCVCNIYLFDKMNNNFAPWKLERHSSNSLSYLTAKSPSVWAKTTLNMYLLLREHLRGRTLVYYSSGILHPFYLRIASQVTKPEVGTYDYNLKTEDRDRLLHMKHVVLKDNGGTEFVFVLETLEGKEDEPVYLMKSDGRNFLVPVSLLSFGE